MAEYRKRFKYNATIYIDTSMVSGACEIRSDSGHLIPAVLTLTEILQLTEFLIEIKPAIVAEIACHDKDMQEHDESYK
jgi:hypothetical protein